MARASGQGWLWPVGAAAGVPADRAAVVAAKILAAVKALQDERGTIHPRAIGNGEEIRPLPQPIHDEIPEGPRNPRRA